MGRGVARRVVAPPAVGAASRIAQDAAVALGWAGRVLPETDVFGCRLHPVVVADAAVHRTRQRDGNGPELDGDTLSMWEWPESPGPAPAVRLSGALFPERRGFRRVFMDARRWRPFGPSAVLAPAAVLTNQMWCWECDLFGVGLVADDPDTTTARLVLPAEAGRRAPARRRTADRWIEESLYALTIAAGVFSSSLDRPRPVSGDA